MSNFGPKFLVSIGLSTAGLIFGVAAPFAGALVGGTYAASALLGGIAGFAFGAAVGPVPFALTASTLLKEGNGGFVSQFTQAYGRFAKDYIKLTTLVARNIGSFLYRPFKKEVPHVAETALTPPNSAAAFETAALKSEFPGNQPDATAHPLPAQSPKDPQPKI